MKEKFQFDVDGLLQEIMGAYDIKVLNWDLVYTVVKGFVEPKDGKRWPPSWFQSEKRLRAVFLGKTEEHFQVFEKYDRAPTALVNEWNDFARLDRAKILRVLGRPVKIMRVYPGGKWFWDFLLMASELGAWKLKPELQEFVKRSKVQYVYPFWFWKHLVGKRELRQDTKVEPQSFGIDVVEDG